MCLLQVGDIGKMNVKEVGEPSLGYRQAVAWKDGWTHLAQARRLLSFGLLLCDIGEVS